MLCDFRNVKEKYGRGQRTRGMKKRTDRARVKELLRTGREVCSRFIVYKKIALAVGPSDASHFLVFSLLNTPFGYVLRLWFGFLSVRMLIIAVIIKPRESHQRDLVSPVCLHLHNVNSFDLKMKLGKGFVFALT